MYKNDVPRNNRNLVSLRGQGGRTKDLILSVVIGEAVAWVISFDLGLKIGLPCGRDDNKGTFESILASTK